MAGDSRTGFLEDARALLAKYREAFGEGEVVLGANVPNAPKRRNFLVIINKLIEKLAKGTAPLEHEEEQDASRSLFTLRQRLDALLLTEEALFERLAAQVDVLVIPPMLKDSAQVLTEPYLKRRKAILTAKALLHRENVDIAELDSAYSNYWLTALDYQNAMDEYHAENPGTVSPEIYETEDERRARLTTEIKTLTVPNTLFFPQDTALDTCYQVRKNTADSTKQALKQFTRGEKTLDELELAHEIYRLEDKAYQEALTARHNTLKNKFDVFREVRAQFIDTDGELIELIDENPYFFDKFSETYEAVFEGSSSALNTFYEEIQIPPASRDEILKREKAFEKLDKKFADEQTAAFKAMRKYLETRINAFNEGRKAFVKALKKEGSDEVTIGRIENAVFDREKIKSDVPFAEVVKHVQDVKAKFERLLAKAPNLEQRWQTEFSDRPRAKSSQKSPKDKMIEKLEKYGVPRDGAERLANFETATQCVRYMLSSPWLCQLAGADVDLSGNMLQQLAQNDAILSPPWYKILLNYQNSIDSPESNSFSNYCREKELLPVLFYMMVPIEAADDSLVNTQTTLRNLFGDEDHSTQYQNIIARLYVSRQSEPSYASDLATLEASASTFVQYTLDVYLLEAIADYPPEELEALSNVMTAIDEAFLLLKRQYSFNPGIADQLVSVQNQVFDALLMSKDLTQGLTDSAGVIMQSFGFNVGFMMEVLMSIETFLLEHFPSIVISEEARELVQTKTQVAETKQSLKQELAGLRQGLPGDEIAPDPEERPLGGPQDTA